MVFFLRYYIFGISSNLSKEEYINEGYGYYSDSVKTECINNSGLCSENGIVSEIKYCIKNSKTERGCIDSNGKQTFKNIINEKVCSTGCRYSIWGKTIETECITEIDDICITKGIKKIQKTCIQNDAYGMNTCTYSKNINSEIFPGCKLTNNGYTVECEVGSIYTETQECEKGEECGKWEVDQNVYENYSKECIIEDEDYYTKYKNCIPLVNNLGYRLLNMNCNKKNCKNVGYCLNKSDRNFNKKIIENFNKKKGLITCDQKPSCIRPCKFN